MTNEAPKSVKQESRYCPQCGEQLTNVGIFWVCPSHGQASEPKPLTALRIFLSYGHDDNQKLVFRIKTDLEQRGHNVWFDKTEIKAGDDWRRSITDGILRSQRVVTFLSKHSTRDPGVCRDEIAIAIGVKGGNIQTILVESEMEVQPPVNIGHIQWLDMHDWREWHAAGAAAWEEWYQTKLAEIVRVVESDESRRFTGEIEMLQRHLKPIRSDARIYDLLRKGFLGRTWLFDEVEKWRLDANRDSRIFWITGAPGVGKSAFAAQLTHTRSDTILAAQFVEWDQQHHRDARRVVCSLAFQLSTRLPDYRRLLLALPEIDNLDRKDLAELFDYLLANPLQSVIGGGRERYLVVIDALDEAGEAGRNPLVEMIARQAMRLPDWLGFVVTSRPESAVQTPLQGLNPFVLDTCTAANSADLGNYLRQELARQLREHPEADRLIGQILEKSEGVFLYAERFCDDVQKDYLSLDRPDQFPQGLGGIFTQWFQRQFPEEKVFREQIRPALRTILAAREPLPVEIIQSILNWQDEELFDFTRTLGSLFPLIQTENGEVIKSYHKSLSDWITDPSKAGRYFVSAIEGHHHLGDACLSYVSQDNSQSVSPASVGYYSRSLVFHLCALKRWGDLVSCIANPRVFQNIWPGSYGLDFSTISHPSMFRNLWPESRTLVSFDVSNISVAPDALTPDALDPTNSDARTMRFSSDRNAVIYRGRYIMAAPKDRPDVSRGIGSAFFKKSTSWDLADAFAARALDLMTRAFEIANGRNMGTNELRNHIGHTPDFIPYRDLVYGFVYLAGLAPAFALSKSQFAEIGRFQGQPILVPLEEEFYSQARAFLEKYQSVRWYLRYLKHFACNEGWSGKLEHDAAGPDSEWQKLACLAYSKQLQNPNTFIRMSEIEYTIMEEVNILAPWGAIQTKPKGVDAFLVSEERENGETIFYMVYMDELGSPVGYSEA